MIMINLGDCLFAQVSIACKDQVPEFGPVLCSPSLFGKGPEFRDWLLTKLLNAEFNCHKAPDFLKLAVSLVIIHNIRIYNVTGCGYIYFYSVL